MTELPKGSPFEPDWMRELREIDQRIAGQIDIYVRWVKRGTVVWAIGGIGGYWIGFGSVELLRWWLGLR